VENKMTEALAVDLALGLLSEPEIRRKHKLTKDEFAAIKSHPAFKKLVDSYKNILDDVGVSIEVKAKAMTETMLKALYEIATDTNISPPHRLEAIRMVREWSQDYTDVSREAEKNKWNLLISLPDEGEEE